jgi:predicted SPOUT superfamily RNA methylase MTH1
MCPEIQLAVPSSLTVETADQKIKTYKVGQVARAAAIFRVNRIAIYRDPSHDDSRFIASILQYMEAPQYLRKLLFPRSNELRYIGVVPPLKTYHHVREHANVRDGIVIDVGTGCAWVEIGLDCPAFLRTKTVHKGERVTVKIFSRDPLEVEAIQKPPGYWGYSVQVVDSIKDALNGLVVLTAKRGQIISPAIRDEIRRRSIELTTFVFGAPNRGVEALLNEAGLTVEEASDFIVNTIPDQGTETVRTEEAIMATLSVFNIALHEST